jgi:hypothetical protein
VLTKRPTDANIDKAMAENAVNKVAVFINDQTKLCAINVLRMDAAFVMSPIFQKRRENKAR